jgi:hypothetical protein
MSITTSLPSIALLAMFSAALLASVGAIFGASIARIVWADDLQQAIRIDQTRSEIEKSLRSQIESLKQQIELGKR